VQTLTAFDGAAPKRAVVQVWDSIEKLQAWRNDPQFKELRQIGEKYATFRGYAIEGIQ
jgi:heme-degrading monooxygenase HmoA